MLSSVLNSKFAAQINISVVKAFPKLQLLEKLGTAIVFE